MCGCTGSAPPVPTQPCQPAIDMAWPTVSHLGLEDLQGLGLVGAPCAGRHSGLLGGGGEAAPVVAVKAFRARLAAIGRAVPRGDNAGRFALIRTAFLAVDSQRGSQSSGAPSLPGMTKTSICAFHETDREGCGQVSTFVLHVTDRQGFCRGLSSGPEMIRELLRKRGERLATVVAQLEPWGLADTFRNHDAEIMLWVGSQLTAPMLWVGSITGFAMESCVGETR